MFATSTVEEPGAYGAVVTGMQGMGVKTPKAAAVADATDGFAIELHIAKGMIFSIGILSMMLAMGGGCNDLFFWENCQRTRGCPETALDHCAAAYDKTHLFYLRENFFWFWYICFGRILPQYYMKKQLP